MYSRLLKPLKSRSFFLFGARGTGKSTLLKKYFEDSPPLLWLDLLDQKIEWEIQRSPRYIQEQVKQLEKNHPSRWVVIDEVQKAPHLLDTVHKMIETKKYLFALTGSSARKLKRGGANLLAGRALQNFLFPLTSLELGEDFNLIETLHLGSLPELSSIDEVEEKKAYLRSYVQTYLKEEIQVEQLVRKLAPFRSFLEISSQSSGTILNYSKIARDIGSDPVSVKNYFSILEDTLLGFFIPSYHRSIRKRQTQHPKFYLFDLGVKTALSQRLNVNLAPQTSLYGMHFEHFIISEIYRYNHYFNLDWNLSYLMTKENVEIDLIIERPAKPTLLIEIKSSDRVTEDTVKSLSKIAKDFKSPTKTLCLSQDHDEKEILGVHCLSWQQFFKEHFE